MLVAELFSFPVSRGLNSFLSSHAHPLSPKRAPTSPKTTHSHTYLRGNHRSFGRVVRVATIFTKTRSLKDDKEKSRVSQQLGHAHTHTRNDESRLRNVKTHGPSKSPYTLPAPADRPPAGWASPHGAGSRAPSPPVILPSLPNLCAFEITSAFARASESSKKRPRPGGILRRAFFPALAAPLFRRLRSPRPRVP